MTMFNVLAIFVHPDDETMLVGGTLALLARSGAAVHYLSARRGEGGELGEPPLTTQENLGKVRETEAALCHRTRHSLFVRKRSEEAGRQLSVPEVIIALEGLHHVMPPVVGQLEDALYEILRPYQTEATEDDET